MRTTEDNEHRYRLPRTVIPSRYGLVLEPELAAGSFVGTEDIAVAVREPVSEIVMNAVDLDITGGYLSRGRRADRDLRGPARRGDRARASGLGAEAEPGDWTLHLDFRGELNDKLVGFYRSTYQGPDGGTEVIATTHFEATDARRAFPSWDEPDLKAVFGVTLIVAPDLTALSNGPEIERTTLDDGRVRLVFADTMSMSTYLVAFVVGHLELTDPVDAGGVPTRVAHVPGKGPIAAFALEIGAHSLNWFAEYYGIPYPDAKVDHIALPDFAQGAMENLGCITYREAALLVDPATSTHGEQLGRRRDRRARARPHVVRRPRHDALVERPVAERGVRDVHGDAGRRRVSPRLGGAGTSSRARGAPRSRSTRSRRRGRSSTRCTRPTTRTACSTR